MTQDSTPVVVKLAAGTISGTINGKTIAASFRVKGSKPPSGDYAVQVMRDPVYGYFLLMAPVPKVKACSVGVGAHWIELSPPGVSANRVWAPQQEPAAEHLVVTLSTAVSARALSINIPRLPHSAEAPLFILSEKSISGRNCIVLTRGFSELVAALDSASLQIHVES